MKLTKSLLIAFILSMLILSFPFVGCAKKTPELGTEENPVIWSFVASVEKEGVAAGATYVDARSRVVDDFPTVMDEVVVIAVTVDIPNDGVQFHPSIPQGDER